MQTRKKIIHLRDQKETTLLGSEKQGKTSINAARPKTIKKGRLLFTGEDNKQAKQNSEAGKAHQT